MALFPKELICSARPEGARANHLQSFQKNVRFSYDTSFQYIYISKK